MRKLASIRKISDIRPIANADNIEVAQIDGWQVVVKKGDFKVGDLCVYFEIDSFLPLIPPFAFLKDVKKMGLLEGYRLRTIKLRGQVSQGLALPITEFEGVQGFDATEGADVTDALNVVKYEKPIPPSMQGLVKGSLPGFIRKTDEERIQNIDLAELESYMDRNFLETYKRDGSSMTVFIVKDPLNELDGWRFGVCSRNLELKFNENNVFWKMAIKYKLEEVMRKVAKENDFEFAIQGEVFGEGIQSNPHNIKGQEFEVFNIWNITKQEYIAPVSVIAFINTISNEYEMGLKYVPVTKGTLRPLKEFGATREALLERADQHYKAEDGSFNEGFVYKSTGHIDGKVVSFKTISNKYLLEKGE